MNAQEAIRRRGKNMKLRAFFVAQPGRWVNARDLEPIAGRQAWRTRVSELRQQLLVEGAGTIENRQCSTRTLERDAQGQPARLWLGGAVISEYRYVPSTRPSAEAKTTQQDATLPFTSHVVPE